MRFIRTLLLIPALMAGAAGAATVTFTASGNWVAPAGVTSVTVEAWGGGGAGGGATGNPAKGGGGAGGQYASKVVAVTPGNTYAIVVGAGGTGSTGNGNAGGDSTFSVTTVVAKGGAGGTGATNGVAGTGSTLGGVGDIVYAGGNGSDGSVGTRCNNGGAGGGGAGSGGAGGNASGNTAGTGRANGGGAGGAGTNSSNTGNTGNVAGGGGGAACAETATDRSGGAGARGQVMVSYAGAGPVTYYHDTTRNVNIGFDGLTNVTSGTNQTIPPVITALLITANTCTGNARSNNHPTGLYSHSRWYLNSNYAAATNIAANPSGSARLRGGSTADKAIVSLYDYDPVTGAKVLIGSSPSITLTGGGTTTSYAYTISSPSYTVAAGHRLMLEIQFNQASGTFNSRVYCSTTTPSYITVTESPVVVAPHHIEIDHDGLGQTCRAETLTVKACANAACSSNFTTATVTGNVTWTGAPGGTLPFTITSGGTGQTTVLLPVSTAQTVALGTSSISPSQTSPPSTCVNSSGGTACSLVFSTSSVCFDAVEVAAAISSPIYTKLSGTAFSLDVLAGSAYTGTLTVELVNASSGTCATYVSLSPPTTQSTTFTSETRKTLSFTYANAARNVKARITGLAASSCSSDNFSIRPQTLSVTSSANADATGTDASATPVVKAGASFTLTATALTGYDGTPVVDNTKVLAHSGAVTNGAVSGVFGAANAATGVAAASSFTYNEAGYFRMDVDGVYDGSFTAVDSTKGECTNDFSNALVSGKYGCKFRNTAASNYFGRFIPDHFDVATDSVSPIVTQGDSLPQTKTTVSADTMAPATIIPVASPAGFFVGSKVRIPGADAAGNAFTATVTAVDATTLTLNSAIVTDLASGDDVVSDWGSYMGEKMNTQFTLNAVDASGSTTRNYNGTYAKLSPSAPGNPLSFGAVDMAGPTYNLALDTSVAATGSFASGSAAIVAPLAVVRSASPIQPYTSVQIGIAPTAAEGGGVMVMMGAYNLGVTSATPDHTSIMSATVQASTEVRYGRLRLSNTFGSERQSQPVTVSAMYYAGSPVGWAVNVADGRTKLPAAPFTAFGTNTTTNACYTAACTSNSGGAANSVWLHDVGGTLIAGAAAPSSASGTTLVSGVGTITLTAPTLAGTPTPGTLEFTLVAPSWLKSNSGRNGTGSNYDYDPTGRVTFGVYGPATNKRKFIYTKENH